jgi:hypothetical protein
MPPPYKVQKGQAVKQKKLDSRLAKLAKDDQRTDGKAIGDTDLSEWIAPPISWSYDNLVHIAIRRFNDFLKIMGPKDARSKYTSLGHVLLYLSISCLDTYILSRTFSHRDHSREVLLHRRSPLVPRDPQALHSLPSTDL